MFDSIGKMMMFAGIILLTAGALFHFGGKFSAIGRLPGDIRIERENFTFYFPLATSILISIILTVLLRLFSKR